MADQLNVDPALLQQAADGINAIIGELSDLGTTETGTTGRGFSLIRLSGLQSGKESVHQSFTSFTSRWSWGIRALVQAGNQIAQMLNLAAGQFHDIDQAFSTMLKESYTDLLGNTHLSKDQVDGRSWSDTLADNGFNDLLHPDYSTKSFDDALSHIGRDGRAVAAIAPDAGKNLGFALGNDASGGRWDTGDAAKAAQIINPQEGK